MPMSCAPKPPEPPATGQTPAAKAIGAEIGAVIRSAGRTQRAVAAATGRKSSPYASSEPLKRSQAIPPARVIATLANSPPPSPVSRGRGIRRAGTGRGRPPWAGTPPMGWAGRRCCARSGCCRCG